MNHRRKYFAAYFRGVKLLQKRGFRECLLVHLKEEFPGLANLLQGYMHTQINYPRPLYLGIFAVNLVTPVFMVHNNASRDFIVIPGRV
jgi:hypothetical protein